MAGTWTLEKIADKPADVFEPEMAGRPRFGMLFLHPLGLETLANNRTYTNLFAARKIPCVCPHVGRSWWTDRACNEFDPHLTPEAHLLKNVLPFFEQRWNLKPRSIGVFGISMGGQGALRLAFRHPQIFPVAAGIASAIDFHELYDEGGPLAEMYDSKEQARQDTALMHIHPYQYPPHLFFCIDPNDHPWYRGNDRLHEKLNALGVPHTHDLTTEAGGHSWAYFDQMAEPTLRFLTEGLEKESRRLL